MHVIGGKKKEWSGGKKSRVEEEGTLWVFLRHLTLSHELVSERASEQTSAVKQASKTSSAEPANE